MEQNKKENRGSIIYAIVGVCTLIVAVAGSAYAYYQASATANISGEAGGGSAPTLTVTEVSSIGNNPLIPIDMDTVTLNNAAKGWDTTANAVGTSWNATNACKDMNGYNVCKIYSVTLKNNSSSTVKYRIDLTSLSGVSTPNIEAVAMGINNTSITSADSIIGVEAGIASNVQLAANSTSSPFYLMVFVKNLNEPQTDTGSFSGTITAIGGDGGRIEAQFD